MTKLIADSERDARAIALAGFQPTAEALAAAYEHVEQEDAVAASRAQVSRVTTRAKLILAGRFGRDGAGMTRADVLAAFAQAAREHGATCLSDTLTQGEWDAAIHARALTLLGGNVDDADCYAHACEQAEREMRAA